MHTTTLDWITFIVKLKWFCAKSKYIILYKKPVLRFQATQFDSVQKIKKKQQQQKMSVL